MRTFDSRADSRAATNNERLSSASRAKVLHEYVEAKQQQFGAARDFDMRVMALADTAGSGIRQTSAATHSRTGIVQRDAAAQRARVGGGLMGAEQRQLAARLASEARELYTTVLTERCASLAFHDALTALTPDELDAAIHLFASFDDDVDGQLSTTEFAALHQSVDEMPRLGIAVSGVGGPHKVSGTGGTIDRHVIFQRADVMHAGFVDLNAMVLHLERTERKDVLHQMPSMASSKEQLPELACARSALRGASDVQMLADAEYVERLVDQAQSVKGSAGFELDQLDDHKLLLRAMSIFRRFDHQRCGTLGQHAFVTMVAPPLERALKLTNDAYTAQHVAKRASTQNQHAQSTLGEQYLRLVNEASEQASEAAAAKKAAETAAIAKRRASRAKASFASDGALSTALGVPSKVLSQVLQNSALASAVAETVNQTALAVGSLGKLPGLATTALSLKEHFTSFDRTLAATLCLEQLCDHTPLEAGDANVAETAPAETLPAPAETLPASAETLEASKTSKMAAFLKCGIMAVESARELFAFADSTGSGAVDFNEFIALLTSGAILRVAEGGSIAMFGQHNSANVGADAMVNGLSIVVDDDGRRRAQEAHRARMVERAMERLTSSHSMEILAQINSPAADEAVQVFAHADQDYSGALMLPEFTNALIAASAHKSLRHGRSVSVGEMEARLWFTALDRTQLGCIDVCQWIQLLVGGAEGAGESVESIDMLDSTALRGIACEAARIGRLRAQRRPGGVNEEAQRQVRATMDLLEASTDLAQKSTVPRSRPAVQGKTAEAEAADDAAFAAKMTQRIADSEARSMAEDERLRTYMSKIVAAASTAIDLSDEGFATLESFSTDFLADTIAMFEWYDSDGDGRLGANEFEPMISMLSRQHGLRFSQHERERLFHTTDLGQRGAVNLVEVLLLLQQLAIPPIAPAQADAYRERLLQTAARSVVRLESEAAATRATRSRRYVGDATSGDVGRLPKATSVLLQPPDTIDEFALLFGRFDLGRKGFLTFDEFASLKNALAVQSGGKCFSSIELRMHFNSVDCDKSGTIDLNELFLHLKTAHPSSTSSDACAELAVVPASGGMGAGIAPSQARRAKGVSAPSSGMEVAFEEAKEAEEARRSQVDRLLVSTTPTLSPEVSRAFGEAELRALAAVFVDLDHGSKDALRLHEFRILVGMLAERAAKAAAKTGRKVMAAGGRESPDTPMGAAVEPLGLREAHAIFLQCGLDANGEMPFAALLGLLAQDEAMSKVALDEGRALDHQKLQSRGCEKRSKQRPHAWRGSTVASPSPNARSRKGRSPKGQAKKPSLPRGFV